MKPCGAKTRSGTPCKRAPMPNGRCKLHGGASLSGMASPVYKHGRYSKHLPTRLAERYGEAQTDSDLLALRDEVALTDARLADVLGRVDQGETGELWKEAGKALAELVEVIDAPGARRSAITRLRDLLTRGVADWAAWDEVGKLLEQRRRLVESERKRLVEMQQTITAERAMLLIGAIAGIIQTHVTDRALLSAISADIGKLVAGGPAAPPGAGGPAVVDVEAAAVGLDG